MGALAALTLLAATFSYSPPLALSSTRKCVSIQETTERVGDHVCVTGKVLRVERLDSGMHVLHFCQQNSAACPFRVVVYPDDLRDVGDVRWMEGKEIQIHGAVKGWGHGAEMKLNDARQLKGETARLPLIPKQYDVESRGKFSAGRSQAPKHKYPKPRKGDVEPQPPPDDTGVPAPPPR